MMYLSSNLYLKMDFFTKSIRGRMDFSKVKGLMHPPPPLTPPPSAPDWIWCDQHSILCRLHNVYVCVFGREKMCQPVEMDNKRALMGCFFCSIHHFGRLVPLMFIISLFLCPIGSWLLWCRVSSLRILCCVTKSSL